MATAHIKKILIVEDEEPLRRVLVEEMLDEGYAVFEGKNGIEGLQAALKEKPDLILLDIVMPKMDGMKMLKNLRKDKWGKKASVILLTNLDNDAGKTLEAAKYGVYEFLIKARWKLKEVKARIREKLHIS